MPEQVEELGLIESKIVNFRCPRRVGINDIVTVRGELHEIYWIGPIKHEGPIPNAPVYLIINGFSKSTTTGSIGDFKFNIRASDIGVGTWIVHAEFKGDWHYKPFKTEEKILKITTESPPMEIFCLPKIVVLPEVCLYPPPEFPPIHAPYK